MQASEILGHLAGRKGSLKSFRKNPKKQSQKQTKRKIVWNYEPWESLKVNQKVW